KSLSAHPSFEFRVCRFEFDVSGCNSVVEFLPSKQVVVGSSNWECGVRNAELRKRGCNSVVEFLPSKQVVVGSNPIARFIIQNSQFRIPNCLVASVAQR